jgi:hypothetical protein
LACLFFSGCIGTKNLKPGEYLLSRQQIKGNKNVESARLVELYQQQPNRRVLIFPVSLYTWMYQTGVRNFDTSKIEKKKRKIDQKFDDKVQRHTGNSSKIARLESRRASKLSKKDDVLKNGNSFMQRGEPLAVFDSSLTVSTVDQMTRRRCRHC